QHGRKGVTCARQIVPLGVVTARLGLVEGISTHAILADSGERELMPAAFDTRLHGMPAFYPGHIIQELPAVGCLAPLLVSDTQVAVRNDPGKINRGRTACAIWDAWDA